MCNPLVMFAASAGITLGGGIGLNKAYRQQGDDAMSQAEYQALIEEDNAHAEAVQIRRQGERARGETLGALAVSGVKVGQGSALDAERQVMQDYTQDEYMTIINGKRSAELTRMSGRRARNEARLKGAAAMVDTAGSLLSSFDRFTRATAPRG